MDSQWDILLNVQKFAAFCDKSPVVIMRWPLQMFSHYICLWKSFISDKGVCKLFGCRKYFETIVSSGSRIWLVEQNSKSTGRFLSDSLRGHLYGFYSGTLSEWLNYSINRFIQHSWFIQVQKTAPQLQDSSRFVWNYFHSWSKTIFSFMKLAVLSKMRLSIDLLILAIVLFCNVPTAETILHLSTFQSDSRPLRMCDIV